MKYVQPFGVVDENASYINGNPSAGIQGSIPPAASIEHPQREIVNLITDNGAITPSAGDLHQLAKAVQAGGINYADDTGTPNQLVCQLTPAPPNLRKGLHIFTIIAHNNYVGGPSTLNVNGLGAKPIQHLDGSELSENELKAGTLALFVYDGDSFQWMTAAYLNIVTSGLTSNRDYYVDVAIGNDTFDGLSPAAGHPFKTINFAVRTAIAINLNGYAVTIHVANGTYPENVRIYPLNGNGTVHIVGNETTPSLCTIQPANGVCITWGEIFPTAGWFIRGFKLTSTVNGAYEGMGIFGGFGNVHLQNMEFGACAYAHVSVSSSCKLTLGGPATFWRISGGAVFHMVIAGGAEVLNYQPQLVITNTPHFSGYFAEATVLSHMGMHWTSISGTATGARYYVDLNSVINVAGAGTSYLPGNAAGTVLTGGQYV